MTNRKRNRPGRWLVAPLFVSGAACLIHEVVWTRWLTELLGSAAAATAVVLGVFMGGLGLGSWLASRVADRARRPVRLYAWVEFGAAFLALVPLVTRVALDVVFRSAAGWWGPLSYGLGAMRLLTAVVAIGPATVLMGATFPLMVRAMGDPRTLGRPTAASYAANNLGGVLGTLLVGFLLVEHLGLRGAFLVAAALGVVAGGMALWMDRAGGGRLRSPGQDGGSLGRGPRPGGRGQAKRERGGSQPRPEGQLGAARLRPGWLLILAGVTGFCSLGYETVWCRVLAIHTLNTTYAFSLMLAILLGGLGAGSWLVRRKLDTWRDPALWFAGVQVSLAAYAACSLVWGPVVAGRLASLVVGGDGSLLAAWLGRPLLLAGFLLFVPSVLMGASLPIACRLYGGLTGGLGRPVGRVYSANTVGSVLGSLVVGLVVIPAWGSWGAAVLCATAGSVAAGVAAHGYAGRRGRLLVRSAAAGVACTILGLGILHPHAGVAPGDLGPGQIVRFRDEDAYGLVEVVEDQAVGTRWLLTNRLHWEGSTLPRAVAEQRKQALLPLLLHPAPRRVLEIGLGTGIKAAALAVPPVEEVTVVEISPAVIEASGWFAPYADAGWEGRARRSCRVQTVCSDGRHFVALVPRRFDIIVNGLLTPYRAGVARLYTIEHFRACREKLLPGGMFVVWVALRQIAPDDLRVVVGTLLEVFPNTTMWLDGYYLALVATPEPHRVDFRAVERRCAQAEWRRALSSAGLQSPRTLLAGFVAGPERLRRFAADRPLNTEDRPIIEFRTPRMGDRLNSRWLAAELFDLLRPLQERLDRDLVAGASQRSWQRLRRAIRARRIAVEGLTEKCRGRHIQAAARFQDALAEDPDDDLARYEMEIYLVAFAKECLERGLVAQAWQAFRQAVRVNPRSVAAWASLAAMEEAAGQYAEAERLWRQAVARDPRNTNSPNRLAQGPSKPPVHEPIKAAAEMPGTRSFRAPAPDGAGPRLVPEEIPKRVRSAAAVFRHQVSGQGAIRAER